MFSCLAWPVGGWPGEVELLNQSDQGGNGDVMFGDDPAETFDEPVAEHRGEFTTAAGEPVDDVPERCDVFAAGDEASACSAAVE